MLRILRAQKNHKNESIVPSGKMFRKFREWQKHANFWDFGAQKNQKNQAYICKIYSIGDVLGAIFPNPCFLYTRYTPQSFSLRSNDRGSDRGEPRSSRGLHSKQKNLIKSQLTTVILSTLSTILTFSRNFCAIRNFST